MIKQLYEINSMAMADVEDAPVVCRICLGPSTGNLIECPCHCRGSLGHVHLGCLEDWLNASRRDACEICSDKYHLVRTLRYKKLESIRVWLWNTRKFRYRKIGGILTTVLLIMRLLYTFYSLCNFVKMEWEELEEKEMKKPGLLDMFAAVDNLRSFDYVTFVIYLVRLSLGAKVAYDKIKLLYVNWRRWFMRNCKMQLVLNP